MQGAHLPATLQQRRGDLSPEAAGDADDQGRLSRILHVSLLLNRCVILAGALNKENCVLA